MTKLMETRIELQSGLNRGALSSLFLNLQQASLSPETRQHFERSTRLSSILKYARVQSEFCFRAEETPALIQRSLSIKAHALALEGKDQFSLLCRPEAYETVHITPGLSAMSNTGYSDRITASYAPTIVVAGLGAQNAVKQTLCDILNQSARAKIILAHDTIDLQGQAPDEFKAEVCCETNSPAASETRIHYAKVSEIEAMLCAIYY